MSKLEVILQAATKAFDAEVVRTTYIQAKAEKFVAAIAVVTGFQLSGLKNLPNPQLVVVQVLSLLALGTLGLALLSALLSMQARGYTSYPRGKDLLELRKGDVTEDSARESIAVALLKAREDNALTNDRRSALLRVGGHLLVYGSLLAVFSRLVP